MKKYTTPCALCVNDLHISKDNISDFQKNWDEVLDVCNRLDIHQILIGGDLFQSRVSQTLQVLMAVHQAFEKAHTVNIKIMLGLGNHDKVDQESVLGYCHVFSKHPNVCVVDECEQFNYGDLIIYIMSYFPEEGSFIDRLQLITDRLTNKTFNILYCHEGINGGLSKPHNKELPAKLFQPFDKVLVGHYHDRCQVPGTNIEYIGASRQHNYGEDSLKGYTIINSDGSTDFYQNQVNTRYYTLEASDINTAKEMLMSKIAEDKNARCKVRITCTNDTASTIDKDILIELGASKVEVVAEASDSFAQEADFSSKYDKNGLKEEYSRFCKQKEIENIQLGLDYLDKIN